MHRFLLLAGTALLSATLGAARVSAAQVPRFEGETLSGKQVVMPQAQRGRFALLIIGFTQASGRQSADWAKLTSPLEEAGLCDVWSVAVLEDVPRLLRGVVARGIRSGVPKNRQDRFLLVYRGAELKQAVGSGPDQFQAGDDAWLLLIDMTGSIQWRRHGPVSDAGLRELRNQLK